MIIDTNLRNKTLLLLLINLPFLILSFRTLQSQSKELLLPQDKVSRVKH